MYNYVIFKLWSQPIFFFVIFFLFSSYSSALEKRTNIEAIYVVGEYGTIEKFDRNWNSLGTNKVPGLFRGMSVRDADISPDGNLLFLGVSKEDTPLIIVNTKDLSIDKGRNIKFPPHGFVTYAPESLIAVTSQYLYMYDESYTSLPDPFGDIMIDINNGTATRLPSPISLKKEDVLISPQRDRMASRYLNKIFIVDVPTGKIIDSIDIPAEYRGRKLTPFDVDWVNNKLTIRKIKSDDGQDVLKSQLDMRSHESVKQKGEKMNIGNPIKRMHLSSDSGHYLIEDDKDNLYIVDKITSKVVDSVKQNITSTIKGYDMRSNITPDGSQLIYLKDDIKKSSSEADIDISRLTVLELKTKKIHKYIEFPEKIVAVIFADK